ncbi:hypothetical protein [Proteiniclasticum sp. QWL-01]|uniref:hypothetical protein n=1 Tax=Proteiniclasticum sp. QWL-01 TaxID=3036945 RepID=UPI002410F941|nr:hypothetical protein [Proteiniclasticum sp. QWL-01]WFF73411.1 hypothetical protein P6M73_02875 [Proteiniclasticum sp. QWL-01]
MVLIEAAQTKGSCSDKKKEVAQTEIKKLLFQKNRKLQFGQCIVSVCLCHWMLQEPNQWKEKKGCSGERPFFIVADFIFFSLLPQDDPVT